jgi:uncharacterized protein YjdB
MTDWFEVNTVPTLLILSHVTSAISPTILPVGATLTFSGVMRNGTKGNLSGYTFAWASSSTGVATVDSSGVVTAVAPGTTTITLSESGTGFSTSHDVVVV